MAGLQHRLPGSNRGFDLGHDGLDRIADPLAHAFERRA
jgi:hypothetical protein